MTRHTLEHAAPPRTTGAGDRRRPSRWLGAGLAAAVAVAGLGAPAYGTTAEETFEVDIDVTGTGSVSGEGSYEAGDTVTLTATPTAGQVWGGWTSEDLDWIGARVGEFTMPAGDVDLDTSFRPQMASLKDAYEDYFQVGNIYSGPATYAAGSPRSATVDRHYGIMTAENAMKPDQLLPDGNIDPVTGEFRFTFGAADTFVDDTLARGLDVHGHVLVWHSQSPPRLNTGATGGTRDLAEANMARYVEAVLDHFSGRIVSWDVVNEAFVDEISQFDPETEDWRDYLRGGARGGQSNWYTAYANGTDPAAGEDVSDFIYDAFVLARQHAPESTLEYNDFNVFQSEGKAQAIIAMATDLNERYAAEFPDDPRQLVEALGDQSHNYIAQTPAFACSDLTSLPELVNDAAEEWQPGACSNDASVERSVQLITEAGFTVNISELDLFVWEVYNGQPEGDSVAGYRDLTDPSVKDRISRPGFTYWQGKITNRAELEAIQAQRFAEYFAVFKKYSQDIDRVTFWGLTDRNSWRATHNPLIFNSDFSEKLGASASADPEGWLGLAQPVTDTSTLGETVDAVDALNLRGYAYTARSIAAVRVAQGRAERILVRGGTQADVNAADAALLDAIEALEPR